MKNKGDDVLGALCAFLLIACYYDYQYRRIPNPLLCLLLLSGLCRSYLLQDWSGVLIFLLSMTLIIVVLYPFYKLGMLGAGDVKLFGICSGYLPYDKILFFLFISMLVAAIISLIKLITEHSAKDRLLYLGDYFWEVVRSGCWHLYIDNQKDGYKTAIPLAGPVLVSVIMYIGGAY